MNAHNPASLLFARRGAHILFEEDFDLPQSDVATMSPEPEPDEPEAPEPVVIEPTFTAAEMDAAREQAWREADELARAELNGAREQATQAALTAIAEHLRAARADAREVAENSAEAVAQLLFASFAAAFPALCRRHGQAEVQAVVQEILPAIQSEPKAAIRVVPDAVKGVERELDRFDPELAAVIKVVASDSLAPGDVRIQWRGGQAIRDTARIWQNIEAALAPAGLLPPAPDIMQQKLRETADAE